MESGENINETAEFGGGFAGKSGELHLKKRQSNGEYLELNEEQYTARALNLLQKEVGGGIMGYKTNSGKVVRWNTANDDYATGISGVKIKTLFPLVGGEQRFNALRERDEREGGLAYE
ncbi:MAG: hypothetical protein FWB96_10395 [Defluviitaleaceae bacterium]|nr:hypothetical protein [Defluviitaleaceae bacterium]MCL2263658.1 hypothetical protein [Defluviitaleaceae bacterium]MCL2263891.1 hypothetical protein [Defluviitaleaceae bacterium]MCL2264149.1 hypothetical protein [Defluviitaleaceae bacterium]